MKTTVVNIGIPSWRNAIFSDLEQINDIADAIHVDLPERPEVVSEKLRLFPEGCFVLVSCGEVVGYGIAHPWLLESIPPLDTFLNSLPGAPDCLYVHDVAILPKARGHQSSGVLINLPDGVACKHSLGALALVSVYDTYPLWERLGFQILSTPRLDEKLQSYGSTARYMRKIRTWLIPRRSADNLTVCAR